jgi:hypothetical protein
MGRGPELTDPSHERHPTRASCMSSDTLYFLTIIGVWKVLGAIAILLPRFPLLKEWAYAGIFFDLTVAAVAAAATDLPWWHVAAPLVITLIAVLSWSLRPHDRTVTGQAAVASVAGKIAI